ncbi:MAG: BON domain-containing protein [Planctomycetota bacterium]|jgi:osmotically-inducible protein OsmY|nr:BON domain-containing protein [Planctomycetota bacterium]MEC7719301.1 BON domain-containing protein [Planctomycetota bacterium]MEC8241580.1 BON domain-containing protein [Planctomycetota bacterium]MEC8305696.1 BON domain-containing protein [Planctomycetota bacterium]MEC8389260.1 BON domain-containing protein [Planctomycetota bacterium]
MAVGTNFDIRIDQDLANHPLMKGKNVRIQQEKRRVILEGDVDSYYDKQMLQEVVRRIEGVEEIENRLLVEWASDFE